MSEKFELIVSEMFSMFEDIVETSEKYIPLEIKTEWIKALMGVAKIHQLNVKIIEKRE